MDRSRAPREAGRAAWLWDALLRGYGQRLPHHPGKWRVCEALLPRTQPTWHVPRRVTRGGIHYELDLRQYVDRYVYYLEHDLWETRALARIVRPGWCVVDVGANIGYYTLLLSRLAGPRGRVYAFEPAAATFAALQRNLALNPVEAQRACALRAALGDGQGSATLMGGAHHALTRLARAGEVGREAVPLTTLDAFVRERGLAAVNLIKVDIEGAEVQFLRGAAATLERDRPSLLIEVNPAGLRAFGSSADELLQRLRGFGYRLFRPTWRGLRPVQRPPHVDHYLNVLALPRSGAGETAPRAAGTVRGGGEA